MWWLYLHLRNDWVDRAASSLDSDLGIATNMGKDITLTEFNECELHVVAMGVEI